MTTATKTKTYRWKRTVGDDGLPRYTIFDRELVEPHTYIDDEFDGARVRGIYDESRDRRGKTFFAHNDRSQPERVQGGELAVTRFDEDTNLIYGDLVDLEPALFYDIAVRRLRHTSVEFDSNDCRRIDALSLLGSRSQFFEDFPELRVKVSPKQMEKLRADVDAWLAPSHRSKPTSTTANRSRKTRSQSMDAPVQTQDNATQAKDEQQIGSPEDRMAAMEKELRDQRAILQTIMDKLEDRPSLSGDEEEGDALRADDEADKDDEAMRSDEEGDDEKDETMRSKTRGASRVKRLEDDLRDMRAKLRERDREVDANAIHAKLDTFVNKGMAIDKALRSQIVDGALRCKPGAERDEYVKTATRNLRTGLTVDDVDTGLEDLDETTRGAPESEAKAFEAWLRDECDPKMRSTARTLFDEAKDKRKRMPNSAALRGGLLTYVKANVEVEHQTAERNRR